MMVITTSAGLAIIIITDSHRLHVYLHLHAHFNIYIHGWRYRDACLYFFWIILIMMETFVLEI